MKLASLYSGGKDSNYSIFEIKKRGHDVVCLISIVPMISDSLLFHFPNIRLTSTLAQAIDLPILNFQSNTSKLSDEVLILERALVSVKDEFGVQGIVHGGISSNFQKSNFEKVCKKLGLLIFSPLWNLDSSMYLHKMLDQKFEIVIVGVSALGLDREWLGKLLDHGNVKRLESLSLRYGFNLNFEGGEAETIVIDCPLYKKKFRIKQGMVRSNGDNGIFEITDYELIDK
ncbi:MAG TPA: diphthine--ammonia ligase [Nitrososphaeraceae archaeon]|nr:diphthine--ammonia ligase [Nitrososphaeraceae archaeon]